MTTDKKVNQQLEFIRQGLLDIGLRGNTLLHFNPGANKKNVEVVDEKSVEILKILVNDKKGMSFKPIPKELDSAQGDLMSVSDDFDQLLSQNLEEIHDDKRHTDTKLQTKFPADELSKRLLRIQTEAKGYIREQGIDVLYLALGFLEWYEDKAPEKPRKAPLMLIPVSLQRETARSQFKINYTEADLAPNLSLIHKLKLEFKLEAPNFEDYIDIDENPDITAYFEEFSNCISLKQNWQINSDEIALGFFLFGQFKMFGDLNTESWPEEEYSPVIQNLLGDSYEWQDNKENKSSNGYPKLEATELHFVKDADPSQTKAILDVKQGTNLVIHGPPGTGKSQTITNIISEALADNKTVLFVAEKMAALEVVKKRLDECRLGNSVLELHSTKSNKKAVAAELQRILNIDTFSEAFSDTDNEKELFTRANYIKSREQLNTYCKEISQPILNSDRNFVYCLGRFMKLKREVEEYKIPNLNIFDLKISDFDFQKIRKWKHENYLKACADIREMVEHLEEMGTIPEESPFAKSKLAESSPEMKHKVNALIRQTLDLLNECQQLGSKLSVNIDIPAPMNISDIKNIMNPTWTSELDDIYLSSNKLENTDTQIEDLTIICEEMAKLKTKYSNQVTEKAWTTELKVVKEVWTRTGPRRMRFLSFKFLKAKKTLQGLMKNKLPDSFDECLSLIDDILKYQIPYKKLTTYLYKQAQLLESKVEEISKILIMELPELKSFQKLEKRMKPMNDEGGKLQKMLRYNYLYKKLCENQYCKEVAQATYSWSLPPHLLLIALQKTWFLGLLTEAWNEFESLQQFNKLSHENIIEEFRKLDKELIVYIQKSLELKHLEKLKASIASNELGMKLIKKEALKRMRHIPIRKLISESGRDLQQIKPVFMMSPMSVATYLEKGAISFDLVIFDEASQVKIPHAIGAIMRAKQVVMVGDSKQLPPTNFFQKSLESEEENYEEGSESANIESILDMFLLNGSPEATLKWHYRSLDDSLIAISNLKFYDNKLKIFPNSRSAPGISGLQLDYTSNSPSSDSPPSIYERGSSRTNPVEAKKIATAVMEHAKNTPGITLGVVAFSTAQRDCILENIEKLRQGEPTCESFFNSDSLEDFFVKNLENVQGDERDAIFVSIGYGKDENEKLYRNFGPLNSVGGERRLNVLITRARKTMTVFSNFKGSDLKTDEKSPIGIKVLKDFLIYAETREMPQIEETGKETDSPFEDEVISAIEEMGYKVEPQLGAAGFYIDIAVLDPNKPGRYILAVECDGATYHSSLDARARDRLRQNALEDRGWQFHRIWSTAWWNNQKEEIESLKASIENSIKYYEELDMDEES